MSDSSRGNSAEGVEEKGTAAPPERVKGRVKQAKSVADSVNVKGQDDTDAFLSMNVMRLKESDVDGRLNVLQKVLSEQMSTRLYQWGRPGASGATISGARSKRVGRKQMGEEARRRKEEEDRFTLNRSIDRVEIIIQKARGLGIEVAPAARRIMQARAALNDRRNEDCYARTIQSQRTLERIAGKEINDVLETVRGRIVRLRSISPSYKVPRDFVRSAMSAVERRSWSDAVLAVDALKTSVRNSEHAVVLNLVLASKPGLVMARRMGLEVGPALEALKVSREELKKEDLEGAVKAARQSRELVGELLAGHRELRSLNTDVKRALTLAETLELETARFRMRASELEGDENAREPVRKLLSEIHQAIHDKIQTSLMMAEKSLADAQEAGADIAVSEETLKKARESLAKNRFMQSVILAGSSMMQSSAALMERLDERMQGIDQFAQGIEAEVESLTQVQEALAHSKEKSIEEFRKKLTLSEEIVSKAFDSAISYTKVSQDIFREAHDTSIAMMPGAGEAERVLMLDGPALTIEDKKSRIAELSKEGKITETQRERLLSILELSESKANLV